MTQNKNREKKPRDIAELDKRLKELEETAKKESEKKALLLGHEVSVEEIYAAFEKIGVANKETIDITMAVYLSSLPNFKGIRPWLVLVGPPSSSKTESVKTLKDLPEVYYLDTMTSNPFASGYVPPKGGKPYDLLDELDGKCFVIRDMTTLFSLNEETVKKLLGELVSIYDGEFSKFSPTRGKKDYKAVFSLLGCITPAALNKHRGYINMIGSRFLFYRLPDLTAENQKRGFEIAWQKEEREKLIFEVRKTVFTYLTQLAEKKTTVEEPGKEMQESLNALSGIIAKGRGIVIMKSQKFTDENGKDQYYQDVEEKQIEEPWRALLQIKGLATNLAAVRGKKSISQEEIKTIADVALSSMPVDRAELVKEMTFNSAGILTSREAHENLSNRSQRTFQRLFQELRALDMADSYKDPDKSTKQAQKWFLKDDIKNTLIRIYGLESKDESANEEIKVLDLFSENEDV